MKGKVALFLILILLAAPLTMAGAAEIEDLEQDHWAYDMVQELVEKGFLSLYDDDTFREDQELTRLEMAEVIARILEHIEERDVALTGADLTKLRELTVEFREELVDLTRQQEIFSERMEDFEDFRKIQQEDLARILERIDGELDQIEVMRKDIEDLERLANYLIDELMVLTALQDDYYTLTEEVEEITARTEQLEDKMITLESDFEEKMEEMFIGLDVEPEELKREMEENRDRIERLETQNTRLLYVIGGLAGTMLLIFLIN